MTQHVRQSTRHDPDSLLDIVATESSSQPVVTVQVYESRGVSDHCLVVPTIDIERAKLPAPVKRFYRNVRDVDSIRFESHLRASSLFPNPSTTADEFALQIRSVGVLGTRRHGGTNEIESSSAVEGNHSLAFT